MPKRVRVVMETCGLGDVTITIHAELTLDDDGTITGSGVFVGPGCEQAFAATGEFVELSDRASAAQLTPGDGGEHDRLRDERAPRGQQQRRGVRMLRLV